MEESLVRTIIAAAPIRPAPYPDEWSESYLGRFARRLGLQRPWRQDLEVLRPMVPRHVQGADGGCPVYGGEQLPGWAVLGRGAQIRYCYVCINDQAFVRARWRIASFTVCTVHDVNLRDGLVEPAVTSQYKHPHKRLIEEITPAETLDGATSPTPLGRAYALAVWGGFERAVLSDATGRGLVDPLAWALLVERLLDAVVTAVRGPDYPPKDVPRHEHRAEWLQKAGLHLASDREVVLRFLLNLPLAAHRGAAIACLGRLIHDEERRRTVISILPLQLLRERLLAAAPGPVQTAAAGALSRALHPEGHRSFEAAEAILGCPPSLLQFLVRESKVQGVKKIQFGRKQYVFIPDAEIERLRRLFSACLTFDELLHDLAIDRQAYWALLDSALLTPIEYGSWRRYRRQEIALLLSRLDSAARPLPANPKSMQPLMGAWLHMRYRHRPLMRQVLDELLEGQLPLYRSLERPGLQAYFVDHTAPDRLRWLSTAHYKLAANARAAAGQLSLWEAA